MESAILYSERPDCTGKLVKVEGEDHVLLKIKMKNRMMGTIEVSKIIAGSNDDLDFELYGTSGAIKFESMNSNFLWIYDVKESDSSIGGKRSYKAIETINKYPDSKSKFPGPRFGIGWIRGHVQANIILLSMSFLVNRHLHH